MGAANTTANKPDAGNILLCCVQRSKNEQSNQAREISRDHMYRSWAESHRPSIPQEVAHSSLHISSIRSKSLTSGTAYATSKESRKSMSPHITTTSSPLPSRRASLLYAGKLPEDWTEEQQEQLRWAVAETARRSQLRPPGHKAMKVVLAARANGQREAAYGGRSLPTTHPILPAQDC